MLLLYLRDLLLALILLFTAFAALHHGPLKNRKIHSPLPFFPADSIVKDSFQGALSVIPLQPVDSPLTLIFYYAPWDATSQRAKQVIISVAEYFHPQLNITAVNCWWPEGECRRQLPRFDSYPVLAVYIGRYDAFQYRGEYTVPLVLRFVERMLYPIKPLHDPATLSSLIASCTVLVLGYFDFSESPQPPGYASFYLAAMHVIERDFPNSFCFSVITNKKVASFLGMTGSRAIYMMLWNSTLSYIGEDYSYKAVMKWVLASQKSISSWLVPSLTKSRHLGWHISSRPVILLVTPFFPSGMTSSLYYNMFQEIAFQYLMCPVTVQPQSTILKLMTSYHETIREATKRLKCTCPWLNFSVGSSSHLLGDNDIRWKEIRQLSCCHSVGINPGSSLICDVCIYRYPHRTLLSVSEMNTVCLPLRVMNSLQPALLNCGSDMCREFPLFFYDLLPYIATVCCGRSKCNFLVNDSKTEATTMSRLSQHLHSENQQLCCRSRSSHKFCDDYTIDECNWSEAQREQCQRFAVASQHWELYIPTEESPPLRAIKHFTGLGCRTNKTLAFLALDSIQFGSFVNSLGINIKSKPNLTTAVIINVKDESYYVLDEQVTRKSLVNFIESYTANTLVPHAHSADLVPPLPTIKSVSPRGKGPTVSVEDISARMFPSRVLNSSQDVVLLFYAHWCVFCQRAYPIFLSAASYFSSVRHEIQFLRVNGYTNDLQWRFTVEDNPTILFIPKSRPADSKPFDPEIPLTVNSLIGFVLVNMQPVQRLQVIFSKCDYSCWKVIYHSSLVQVHRILEKMRSVNARLDDVNVELANMSEPSCCAGSTLAFPSAKEFSTEHYSSNVHAFLPNRKTKIARKDHCEQYSWLIAACQQWTSLRQYRTHLSSVKNTLQQRIQLAWKTHLLLGSVVSRDVNATVTPVTKYRQSVLAISKELVDYFQGFMLPS